MTNNGAANPLSQRLAQALDGHLLQADKPTGAPLMCMPEMEEQTAHYLSIEHGESADRGMLTGALGGGCFLIFGSMSLVFFLDGRHDSAFAYLAITLTAFLLPFLWEVFRPLPLPILFNRRTREIYFEQDGQLFHSPWDGIAAAAYTFDTVGPYTGGMRHAALEALLYKQTDPDTQVLINLGSPLGKSLEMQLGFWEYLRAYMDYGPWFDEQGRNCESPAFNQSLLQVRKRRGHWTRLQWRDIKQQYKTNGGRNFLSASDVVLLMGGMFLAPVNAVQTFTYTIAKRRSRTQWPKLVRERLDPMGPTSRLVDLEQRRQ